MGEHESPSQNLCPQDLFLGHSGQRVRDAWEQKW